VEEPPFGMSWTWVRLPPPPPKKWDPKMGPHFFLYEKSVGVEIAEMLAGSRPLRQPGGLSKGISGVPATDSDLRSSPLRGRHRLWRCGPILPALRCGRMIARPERHPQGDAEGLPPPRSGGPRSIRGSIDENQRCAHQRHAGHAGGASSVARRGSRSRFHASINFRHTDCPQEPHEPPATQPPQPPPCAARRPSHGGRTACPVRPGASRTWTWMPSSHRWSCWSIPS